MAEVGDEVGALQEENGGAAASAEERDDEIMPSPINSDGAQSSGPVDDEDSPASLIEEVALPANRNPAPQPPSGQDEVPQPEVAQLSNELSAQQTPQVTAGSSGFKVPTVSKKKDTADNSAQRGPAPVESGKNNSGLSPAEQLKHKQAPIPYKEPTWGGVTEKPYSFDVVKNGVIIDSVKLTKSFYVFGRLPACDVMLEHPSLSRYHAVVQFCGKPDESHEEGWYVYDLGSTHGTSVNKNQLKPKVYYRLRVGHVLKFAGSTRLHILQGPEDDQEDESQLTVTELKEKRVEREKEKLAEVLQKEEDEKADAELKKQKEAEQGCSWGMGDDAETEAETSIQLSEFPENEHLYIDDPKKALKNFFEREGWDLPDYQLSDQGWGKHKCFVELPVDTPSGEPLIAEVTVTGKKKEAVIACALEACRLLDRHGELRKSHQESRKKKAKNWEDNDFYDSDDDTFLDRTGTIEEKRQKRMKRAGKLEEKAESFASLSLKLQGVEKEIKSIEDTLAKAKAESAQMEAEDVDALDAFMTSIRSGAMDTKTRLALKRQLFDLRKERGHLQKLVNIARPANMPPIMSSSASSKVKTGAMFGKMRGRAKPLPKVISCQAPKLVQPQGSEEEEEEEEDDDDKVDDNAAKPAPSHSAIKEDTISERLSPSKGAASTSGNTTDSPTETTTTDVQNTPQSSEMDSNTDAKKVKDVDCNRVEKLPDVSKHKKDSGPENSAQALEARSEVKHTPEAPQKRMKPAESVKSQEAAPEFVAPPAKKRAMPTSQSNKKKESSSSSVKTVKGPQLPSDYATDDPNYAVWVPPKGQTGDGKTHLNAKYGY